MMRLKCLLGGREIVMLTWPPFCGSGFMDGNEYTSVPDMATVL